MGGALSVVRPCHPGPSGEHALGCLRARLPPAPGSSSKGLLAQVHYPADPKLDRFAVETVRWFRYEVIEKIATGYGLPLSVLSSLLSHTRQLDAPNAPKHKAEAGWPIVLFTSGIWGSCEMYTQFCREVASSGAIVIALEHEDGSGLFATNRETGEPIPYAMEPPAGCDPLTFRQPFLELHAEEIATAGATIRAVARGDDVAGKSPSPGEAALVAVLRNGNPDQVCLIGHSFGAAAAVRHLRHLVEKPPSGPSGLPAYNGLLLMDLWGAPLLEEDLTFPWPSQVPVAFLISEGWYNAGPKATRRLMQSSGVSCLGAAAVRGTSHQWISESHQFAPGWLLKRIQIAGPGHLRRTRSTSFRAAQHALQAFTDPSRAKQFDKTLAELDTSVLIMLEQ